MPRRIPSIHITESHLAKLLMEMFEDTGVKRNWNKVAQEIASKAKGKTLNTRSVIVSNDKLERKIKTMVKASASDTDLLANLIYHVRRSKTKLFTTKKIDKDSRDYIHLKELTQICLDFCNTFGLEKRKGFIKYLELAIPKITSSMNYTQKLVNMAEKIYQLQEANNQIEQDENSVETRKIHDAYVSLIAKKTGLVGNKDKDPITYVKFIEVRRLTDELDIPIDLYLEAQFHGLSWTDSFPEPNQLVGDNAISRLNKYLYENKIKTSSHKNSQDDLKDALLKLKAKNGNNRSK